ncbi:hypothetical protein BJV82DRAFT_608413 [Fennellomyces sp. T-0311]|nr:hypothetical protein BJV82DRAFT_608413 [Fennellomyces sp. T-0311]
MIHPALIAWYCVVGLVFLLIVFCAFYGSSRHRSAPWGIALNWARALRFLSYILKITRIYDCVYYFTPKEWRRNSNNLYPSKLENPTSVFYCFCNSSICLFQAKSLWLRVTKPTLHSDAPPASGDAVLPIYQKQERMATDSREAANAEPPK